MKRQFLYRIESGALDQLEHILNDVPQDNGKFLLPLDGSERLCSFHPSIHIEISPLMDEVKEYRGCNKIEEVLNKEDSEKVIRTVLNKRDYKPDKNQIVDVKSNLDGLCLKNPGTNNAYFYFDGIVSSDIIYIDGRCHVREQLIKGHYYPRIDCGYVVIYDKP
jgi:hypothetical protein